MITKDEALRLARETLQRLCDQEMVASYDVSPAIAAIDAALAVPDGWVLVPKEPTDEMLTAAARASMRHLIDCIHDPARAKEVGSEKMCKQTHASRYRSMIAAAPTTDTKEPT